MNFSNIQIKSLSENGSVFTKLFIDGHEIKGIRSFELSNAAGNVMPILKLELNALSMDVDTTAIMFDKNLLSGIKITFTDKEGDSFESP